MKKVFQVILILFLVLIFFSCNSIDKETHKNTITIEGDNLLYEGNCSTYINIDSVSLNDGKQVNLKVDINNDKDDESFTITRDTPNGIKILGFKGKYGCGLDDFKSVSAFDEYGELLNGYSIQLTCSDLDKDNIDEILVSVGDSLIDMETLVYRLSNEKETPFILAGSILGQDKIYFDAEEYSIYSPYGSQGLADIYKFESGIIHQEQY
jgi:hypothetical protein